jgi:hypothetical protein
VPWCATCDRFYNPNSLRSDGTCPACGRTVADPVDGGAGGVAADGAPERLRRFSDEPAPWHFKVLLVAVIGYLGWRLLQGLGWIVHLL